MIKFLKSLWARLFPEPSPWVVELCDLLEMMPMRFHPTYLGDGYYKLDQIGSKFNVSVTFSFEEATIHVESLHTAVTFNSKESAMLRHAVEIWADSVYGQDFLDRCDAMELDQMSERQQPEQPQKTEQVAA
jgi:hypothetical protein